MIGKTRARKLHTERKSAKVFILSFTELVFERKGLGRRTEQESVHPFVEGNGFRAEGLSETNRVRTCSSFRSGKICLCGRLRRDEQMSANVFILSFKETVFVLKA